MTHHHKLRALADHLHQGGECDDEDAFDLDEAAAYMDKIEASNAGLRRQLRECRKQLKAVTARLEEKGAPND